MSLPTLWRAQAQLLARDGDQARVRIPAMERDHDVHSVAAWIIPDGIDVGERFYLRCSLDPDDFHVGPER